MLGGTQGETEFSSSVLKWNGTWKILDEQMLKGSKFHETILLGSEVYHFGGCSDKNCNNQFRLGLQIPDTHFVLRNEVVRICGNFTLKKHLNFSQAAPELNQTQI